MPEFIKSCFERVRSISIHNTVSQTVSCIGKGKGFTYSTPSVGPAADPSVQAVSLQVTVSHPAGGRLPLLSARPADTSPASCIDHPINTRRPASVDRQRAANFRLLANQ